MCQSWAHQPRERREVAVERGRASAARCVRRATHKQLGTAPARGDDRDERAQRVETRARVDVSSSRARRRRRRRLLIVLFVFFRLFCFVGRRLGVADGDAAASRGGVPRAVRRVRDRVGGGDAGGARVGRHERPERLHERGHADLPPRQVASAGRERACRSERRDSRRRSFRAQHGDERRERYPNPEAPLRSCARERVKGQGRARWRRLWRSNLGWRCAERNRAHLGSDASFSTLAAPSSRLESSSDTRSSWADATAARGSSSSGGASSLIAHCRRRPEFRHQTRRLLDVVETIFASFSGAEMSSRVSRRPARPGLGSAPLRTAMGRGGHSDDEATPYDQSLEELEFMRGACAAAQRGDLRTLRDAVARRPHLLADDGVGGTAGTRRCTTPRARDTPRASPSLLEAGARVDRATKEGRATATAPRTPGGATSSPSCCAPAQTRAPDADGETALHKAAARGWADSCALLLRACPEAAEARDRRGAVPLERVPDGDRATRDAVARRVFLTNARGTLAVRERSVRGASVVTYYRPYGCYLRNRLN